MDALQQAALRQQRIEELCAASVRALTGRTNLAFRGRRLYEGSKRVPVHAPHLQVDLETDDFGSFRGATDSIALRLRHTDPELHASLSPAVPVERLIFELQLGGRVFPSNAIVGGRFAIRSCIVNYRTEADNMDEFVAETVRLGRDLDAELRPEQLR